MKIERKPRETNQQLIRRFGREILIDGRLLEFKDKQHFQKKMSKQVRKKRALRSAEIAREHQEY